MAFMSDVAEQVSIFNYQLILRTATSDKDEPTSGFVMKEITDSLYTTPTNCDLFVDYLTNRLRRPSVHVKLKVLKLLHYLCQYGPKTFRNILRNKDGYIKDATEYRGTSDPILGVTLYNQVGKIAQELLNYLFDPVRMCEDETDVNNSPNPQIEYGAIEGHVSTGKYGGFGYNPIKKEATVVNKVKNFFEKIIYAPSESEKLIKSILEDQSSSYQPVDIIIRFKSDFETMKLSAENNETEEKAAVHVMPKSHIPGKAGGGWESSDEDDVLVKVPLNEISIYYSTECVNVASEVEALPVDIEESLDQFCVYTNKLPVSRKDLNNICQKCENLNPISILKIISDKFQNSVASVTLIRCLLILEWFIVHNRTKFTPSTIRTCLSADINMLIATNLNKNVNLKATKVMLILDKLHEVL